MNKRKPDAPQLSMPLEAQAMLTWDERGNVLIVAVANTYDAKRDAKILQTASNDATISKTKGGQDA